MNDEKKTAVVPFTPERLPLVRAFSERYWRRPRGDAYYAWRYLRTLAFGRMFLAVQDDTCLGVLSALRKPYRLGGEPTALLEVFDWHALPGQRGTGVGIRLMRAMMRQPERLLSVGGMADVIATLPLMGWQAVGAARRFELPVTTELVEARLRHRTRLPALVTAPAAAALRAGWYAPRRRGVPDGGRVAARPEPDSATPTLYRGDTGYGWLQEPDGEVLRWVLDGRWSGRYEFLTFTVEGRERGWALTRAHRTEEGVQGTLVEVFAPRPDVALYAWMVSEAAVSLLAARPRYLRARASCPLLQAALEANHFRKVVPDVPVYTWPKLAGAPPAPLHVTLNHTDGPLIPYEPAPEDGAGPAADRAGEAEAT